MLKIYFSLGCLACLLCGCTTSSESGKRPLTPNDTITRGCDCSDEHFVECDNCIVVNGFGTQRTEYSYTSVDVVESFYFGFDSVKISPKERKKIEDIAKIFARNKSLHILIIGNCDKFGAENYNHFLGQRRAEAIRNAFVELGVDSKRITTASLGSCKARNDVTTKEGGALDRRCDIIIRRL